MKAKNKVKSITSGAAEFKIEKGVALPAKTLPGALSPVSRTMLELEAGDSFLIDDQKPDTVMSAVRAMNRRMRKQKKTQLFTGRRTTEGVRVWRMK